MARSTFRSQNGKNTKRLGPLLDVQRHHTTEQQEQEQEQGQGQRQRQRQRQPQPQPQQQQHQHQHQHTTKLPNYQTTKPPNYSYNCNYNNYNYYYSYWNYYNYFNYYSYNYNKYNYNYTTHSPHCIQQLRVRTATTPKNTTPTHSNHLSVHQWIRSAIHASQQPNLSSRLSIFEPSATALCGTTGICIIVVIVDTQYRDKTCIIHHNISTMSYHTLLAF